MLDVGGTCGTDLCSQHTQIMEDSNIILRKKVLNSIRFPRLTSDILVLHLSLLIPNRAGDKSLERFKTKSSRLDKRY